MAMTTVRTIKKVKRVGHEHLIFESQKENLKTFLVWRRFWSRGVSLNYIDRRIFVLTKSKVWFNHILTAPATSLNLFNFNFNSSPICYGRKRYEKGENSLEWVR